MGPISRRLRRHFLPTAGPLPDTICGVRHFVHTCPALVAAWLALSAPVQAQPPAEGVSRALELARSTAAARAPAGARVQATAGPIDPRLQLAPCAHTEVHLPRGTPVWGRTRVGLRCTQGAVAWNVFLPIEVQVLAPAQATTTALPAGARLGAAELTALEVDWGAGGAPFSTAAELVGRTLARPVPAGHALRAADLQSRQWFSVGDAVRIRAHGAGFAISGEGLAVTNGIEGQPARVRTEQGRILSGVPTGEKRIDVSL